jgi:hypothetical protein
VAGTAIARAQGEVNLGIKPVGQQGSFFVLTLKPGESQKLSVELGNFGTEGIAARTYPADAYTLINGGFGVKLRSDPRAGTTKWMDYKEEVLQLAPRQGVTREFTVTVPPGTPPGEYITALVVENDKPVKGSGGVALDQVNRHAIAVSITVPGVKAPGLKFNGAKHLLVGDKSVVSIGLENTGNVLLKPSGRLVVTDSANKTVFSGQLTMDSFYAFSASSVEVPVSSRLSPGKYFATLSLSDKERGLDEKSGPLPFTVEAGAAAGSPNAVTRVQDTISKAPPWGLIAGAGVLVLVLLLGVLLGRRTRKD